MANMIDGAVGLGMGLSVAAIFYYVTTQILSQTNNTGGMWDIGLFLIPVVVVLGGIGYFLVVFSRSR